MLNNPSLINVTKYICCAAFLAFQLGCNNSNSIPLKNLKVLYEKDAILSSALQKVGWKDITCPSKIDLFDASSSGSNCYRLQKQGWKKIKFLSDIKLQTPSPNNLNFFWIQGEAYIEEKPEFYHGIYLDHVGGRDIIYINQKLIGIKNVDRFINLAMPSQYEIPPGVLIKGKNIVFMRLEIANWRNGGVSSNAFIQPKVDYDRARFWNNIRYKHIPAFNFNLVWLLFFISIIQIIIDRKEKMRLLSFFFLLINVLATIPFAFQLENINVLSWGLILFSIVYIFTIYFILFFQALHGLFLPRENKIFIPLIVLSAVIFNIVGNYSFRSTAYIIITFMTLLFGLSAIGYVFYKLSGIKSDRLRFYFFFLIMIVFILSAICDFIAEATQLLYWPIASGIYLFPAYLLLFVIYGTFETKKKRKQQELLYEKLKNKQPSKIKITDSSEEKLAKVIEFINENYIEDISREGLAAAIDINPNYLSSLFNAFTGKKIHEYINLLRIKAAAELIKSTDKKIIDIAFSVGFINLSTFIRAFKKEIGKTPKEYREEYSTATNKQRRTNSIPA